MDAILDDLRLALRGLWKSAGFSLIVVTTLALGIGANTATFSVLYGVVLRPLPYPDPDALVVVQGERDYPSGTRVMNFSPAEYEDWVQHSRAFSSFGMVGGASLVLNTDAGVEPLNANHVSEHFFATVAQPIPLGRPIRNDHTPVAVISHRLWSRIFGADPQVLGRAITLNGDPYTVVGVTSPDFRLPDDRVDVWTPLAYVRATGTARNIDNRNRGGHQLIARLKPGVTLNQAREDVAGVIRVLEPHFNETRRGTRPRITPLAEYVSGISDVSGNRTPLRPALLTLLACVALVLLVVCANVANLMLARHHARTRETAIRAALGAGRSHLIRQSLAESVGVTAAGAVAGIGLAWGAIWLLTLMQPAQLPRLVDVRVDGPVLVFAVVAALLTVVLSGLVPAIHGSRADLVHVLKANTRTQTGPGARRLRAALVVSELAIAIVLLVGATLLGRSFLELLHTDLGIRTEGVLTAQVNLTLGRNLPAERVLELAGTLVERLRALPGVAAAGVGSGLPPGDLRMRNSFSLPNPVTGSLEEHMVSAVPATPEYFSVLRIALVKGRLFTAGDGPNAPRVVIITDEAARRFFGDRDPIGHTLPIDYSGDKPGPVPVVGVVKNVKYSGIDAPSESVIYRPFAQAAFSQQFLVARTTGDPLALANDVRAMIRSVDPQINIVNVRTLDQAVYAATAQPRFRTVLLSSIAGLALALAAVGLYGVIAYSVSQRTTEIGVRVALGAGRSDVMRMVVGEAALLIAAGVAIGTAAAFALSRTLSAFLYGVTPTDPASFVVAAGALVLVALAATYLPARRAASVDPVVALRSD